MTNTIRNRYRFNQLPDNLKANYVGEFNYTQFKDKVTELWNEKAVGKYRPIEYQKYEEDFENILTHLLENQLNDYTETNRHSSSYGGHSDSRLRVKTHTDEEIRKEINTLNAYRSILSWDEEIYVSEQIEIGVPDSYESESWQEGLTKEDVKDFISGKKELKDFTEQTHSETLWEAFREGMIDLEVYETYGKKGGVRISSITLKEFSDPYAHEVLFAKLSLTDQTN